ncbi:hypothetical protein [uncultured Pedobacter sp.]|uniref:hypothetical protein n=1 Tax=uncultured Pedobacter sp. TaxID=246139 RepID=UPI0025E27E37|nr:hypothetical protein [uncultured Pedobacter sp.]
MTENYPKEPMMEDYLSLLANADAQQLPEIDLRRRFLEIIQPLLTIANNNGFEYMGRFSVAVTWLNTMLFFPIEG